jgi:hypothetical protein
MRKKVTRKGSGRTKGSFSFVSLTLAQLNGKFADQTTPIIVGRKFAEQMGFQDLVAGPAGTVHDRIEGQTPASRVTAKVVDLDKE